MDKAGGKVSDDFVDALFDDPSIAGRPPARNPVVVPRNMVNVTPTVMHGVPQAQMGANVHATGLASFSAGVQPSTRPVIMPNYGAGTAHHMPPRMDGATGLISAAPVRGPSVPSGGVIPANLLPSSVSTTGFASGSTSTGTPMATGGLSAMGTKLSANPQGITISGKPSTIPSLVRPAGASPITVISSSASHAVPSTSAGGHHLPASQTSNAPAAEFSRTSSGPISAPHAASTTAGTPTASTTQRAAQPVSAKTSASSMSRAVSSTTVPAPKKQMISADGVSRARNADGSASSSSGGYGGGAGGDDDDDDDGEDRDDLITRQDAEEVSLDPIIHGKSKLTEEEMRRERMKDENRKIVNARVVKVKSDAICAGEHLRASPKLSEAIALGLQRRLEDALTLMVEYSRRRMDFEGDISSPYIARSSNTRLYLKEEERRKQEEREKRIATKLAAESGTAVLDPSALRRQEEETAATVLDMAGGARPRRTGLAALSSAMDVSSSGTYSSSAAAGSHISTATASSTMQSHSIKDRSRKVTLHDALNFLRQDAHCKHSMLTLNTLAGIKPPESSIVSVAQYNAAGSTSGGMMSAGGAHPTIVTRSAAASSSSSTGSSSSLSSSSSSSSLSSSTTTASTTGGSTATGTTATLKYGTSAAASTTSSAGAAVGIATTKTGPSPRPVPSSAPMMATMGGGGGLASLSAASVSTAPSSTTPSTAPTRVTRSGGPTQKK